QILGGLLPDVPAAFLAERPHVVHAPDVVRDVAAAVRDADPELRVALERAVEDQVADGDGRLERIADDVVEGVLGEAPAVGESERMDENQNAEFLGLREERLELRLRELLAVDVGADLDAA